MCMCVEGVFSIICRVTAVKLTFTAARLVHACSSVFTSANTSWLDGLHEDTLASV